MRLCRKAPTTALGEHPSHLLDRVDDARGHAAEMGRQVAGTDGEHRGPDAPHTEAAEDETRREIPAAGAGLGGPVDVARAGSQSEQTRDEQVLAVHLLDKTARDT